MNVLQKKQCLQKMKILKSEYKTVFESELAIFPEFLKYQIIQR